jgi:glycosyltransferase involved in cell wall biosynthesis
MTQLSLVMIVKDAADLLPGFLTHHAGLWDEAVIVDTGSRDATASLAAAAGARVLDRPWQDDFSAARNAGLAEASGTTALLLDADERIAAGDFAAVRAAAGEACAWLQETINYTDQRSHLEWRPVRGRYPAEEQGHSGYFAARRVGLFPLRGDIRFVGRIHESVLPSCEAAGVPVRTLEVPVHHYGYVRTAAVDAGRRELYERLAASKLAEAPGDWGARLEYATALLEGGRPAEAATVLAVLAAGPGGLRPVARGRFLLARLRREEGRSAEAGDLLAAAVADDPTFVFGWVERVRWLAAAERWREAFDALTTARAACGADEALLDREELVALVRTGQLDAARALAARLAAACPGWSEIVALDQRLSRQPSSGGPVEP